MNVLPIVISLILLMAALTYHQMDSFLTRSVLRLEALCTLQNASQESTNQRQLQLYEKSEVKSGKTKEQNGKVDALKSINLTLFANAAKKDIGPDLQIHEILLKRLIAVLYGDRPFFQEAEQRRPDLIEELTAKIFEKLQEKVSENKGLRKVEKLANLQLDDPELELIFAKMLAPVQTPESFAAECASKEAKPVKKRYYPTLLDFVTFASGESKPYRVWLMPKELLLAVYQDPQVVSELMETRKALYGEIRKADKEIRPRVIEQSSSEFRVKFQAYLPFDMPQPLFNFEASNTDPKN